MNIAPVEFAYELVYDQGSVSLQLGGEVLWVSIHDDEFAEDFGSDALTVVELPDVIDWLRDEGYIPPRLEVDVIDPEGTSIPIDEPGNEPWDDDDEDDNEAEDEDGGEEFDDDEEEGE